MPGATAGCPVVQVERVDEPTAHEQEPEAVGRVAGEVRVVLARQLPRPEAASGLNFGLPGDFGLRVRLDRVLLALLEGRRVEFLAAGQGRARFLAAAS